VAIIWNANNVAVSRYLIESRSAAQSLPGAYAQAEVFYDTRFGAWNRQLYQAGVELGITKHWRIEPYYAREEDQRSSTSTASGSY
jgi:hypothetical protein